MPPKEQKWVAKEVQESPVTSKWWVPKVAKEVQAVEEEAEEKPKETPEEKPKESKGKGRKGKGKRDDQGERWNSRDDWDERESGGKRGGKGKGKGKDRKGKSDRWQEQEWYSGAWDDGWYESRGKGSRGDDGWNESGYSSSQSPQKKERHPQDGQGSAVGSSALNSSAPHFQPSGMMFGYDGGMWGWPPQPPQPTWTEYKAEDGTPYYYNGRTGLTQWEMPPELVPRPKEPDRPRPQSTFEERYMAREGAEKGEGGGKGERRRRDDDGERRPKGEGRKGQGRKPASKDKEKEESDFGPPGCNLFVFHLPDDWADDDLNEYFAPHGNVVSAKVMKELGTGRSRGFGFVSYEDRVSAATAIKKMQGYKILGKRLKVEFKKGEGESNDDAGDDEEGGQKKSMPDDERLIGYLRAISAKNVVQSLKEAEEGGCGGAGAGDDEDGARGEEEHPPTEEHHDDDKDDQ